MNILIVDDHEMIAELFSTAIQRHLPHARTHLATSLKAGLKILEDHAYETFSLAIVDLVIHGESEGAATIANFRKFCPTVPVLAVSGLDVETVAPAVFDYGAHGFLPKFCSSDEFIRAVSTILKGERFVSSASHIHMSKPSRTSRPVLSERQLLILELIGSGFSDKSVAKELGITDETVAYHLKNAFRILDVSTRTQAITQAFRRGLLAVGQAA
jgi:two-component system, NarL family, nitrate/nitrite response regulator NarL